jgi:hypothetical protein
MTITITLPDELARDLQYRAEEKKISLDTLVVDLLNSALADEFEAYPTLEEVVARIKATPPNPASIRQATGSLAEALQNAPEDPDFNLEIWTQQWDAVEAEIKAITRANDIAEGRG